MPSKKTILSIFLSVCITLVYAQENGFSSDKSSSISEQFDKINTIEIYPNPSVKYLIVEIENSKLNNVEFEIRSIIGNKLNVIPESIGSDKYRFNVQQFAPGYYFLVIKDDNTQFKQAHKFLKK